ncbi:MAG TPA: cytochrome c [Thermoanaerobaculia bacterium]|nr:cytochrome c [Thermoanaerobaculia bacterium]
MTTRQALPLYTLALSLVLVGAAGRAVSVPPAPAGWALKGNAERGKTVFASRCTVCHGEKGNGKGLLKGSNPPPTDFTDRAKMAKHTDWEIYLVIRDGGQVAGLSPSMAGWGPMLTDQEVRDAAAYVRSLGRR